MKKALALLLVLVMAISAFGCTTTTTPDPTTDPGTATPTQAPTPTEAPATTGPDGREYAEEQVYRTLYSNEYTTMNYLSTGSTYELSVGANTIDSLVENDSFGNIVPCGAESWEVSEDGLTWTFHIRQGQYWYDADGNQQDPVTAHDYVAAARYVCDAVNECSNSYLMEGWLVNAEERVEYTAAVAAAVDVGTQTEDDDYVVDANGVVYERTELDPATPPEGAHVIDGGVVWTAVTVVEAEDVGAAALDDYTLQYTLVIPRPYFLTVLQFGTYWPAPVSLLAELGKDYALDNYSMWFNGAYLLSTYLPNERCVYTKNENNWDAEHIYIERVERTCNTEAATLAPELFLRGEVDYADIGADIVGDWLSDPERSMMISSSRVVSDYSYFFGFCFEPKFDAEYGPENWTIAVNNENFRKTMFHALNRSEYTVARFPGDDPAIHLINTVTPPAFAVNEGQDYVTYGDLAQYTATESFNEAEALAYKELAMAELTEAGATFPIQIPINYQASSNNWANATVVLEQQVENLLGADFVDIVPVAYSGNSFLSETRRNGNYAMQELNWGADFMDPETWADPFAEVNNSYNFFTRTSDEYRVFQNTKSEETLALVDEYFALQNAARAETSDVDVRYEKFAAAEAFYLDHAIVIPMFVSGGSYQATKLNGFEGQFATMGQSSSRYKGMHVYTTAMSQEMFDAQYEAWRVAMGY